ALRLSYLRDGGHDAAILAHLLDLQLEATALEKRAAQRRGKCQPQHRAQTQRRGPVPAEVPLAVPAERPGGGTQGLDAALLAVELENRRLEDELLTLKVRRERRADAGSLAVRQHAEELAQLHS
ncbi:CCD17 protein, partial [Penelope pileata]|nr:CCD17 protein [Penelope pileata]